jgi:hypothetical protein
MLKLADESLSVLQIRGIETFREPVIDVGEHGACFIATALAASSLVGLVEA